MTGRGTKATGDYGENLAAQFLEKIGYEILARNFRFERGEIDIIARHEQSLVFVEVKTAKSLKMGSPETWVTPAKQKQIGKVAQKFLFDLNDDSFECRFDVIAITLQQNSPQINHIKNAFWLQQA